MHSLGWQALLLFGLSGPFSSCSVIAPGEPVGEFIDTTFVPREVPRFGGAVAFTFSRFIYFQASGQDVPRLVSQFANGNRKRVALNYTHDRIAYINRSFRAEVVDLEGNVMPGFGTRLNVQDLGWRPDGSLYVLVGNQLLIENGSGSLPAYSLPTVLPSVGAVSSEGDVVYLAPDPFNNRTHYQIDYANPALQAQSARGVLVGLYRWARFLPTTSRLLIAEEEQDASLPNVDNVAYWWNPETKSLQPSAFSDAGSSPVPGPGNSIFCGLNTQQFSNNRNRFTNVFWLRRSDQDRNELVPLTLNASAPTYVSVDWKP